MQGLNVGRLSDEYQQNHYYHAGVGLEPGSILRYQTITTSLWLANFLCTQEPDKQLCIYYVQPLGELYVDDEGWGTERTRSHNRRFLCQNAVVLKAFEGFNWWEKLLLATQTEISAPDDVVESILLTEEIVEQLPRSANELLSDPPSKFIAEREPEFRDKYLETRTRLLEAEEKLRGLEALRKLQLAEDLVLLKLVRDVKMKLIEHMFNTLH